MVEESLFRTVRVLERFQFLRYLCRVVHSCAATIRCEGFFLGPREGHKNRRFHIAAFLSFLSFFLGLQGQHIILCASGNSSKFSGIHSFQEYLFSLCSCSFYRLFRLYSISSRASLRLQVTANETYDLQVYRCVV